MPELGIAIDEGKDSPFIWAANEDRADFKRLIEIEEGADSREDDMDELVKSPGTIVISAYAPVKGIDSRVTLNHSKCGAIS